MYLRFAGFCGAVLLAGCAGISKEECLYADWQAIGYEDGAAGLPVSAVSSKRAACAKKAGVTVDMNEYRAGREAGLTVYCEPSNGFTAGSRGATYYGVCAGPEGHEFSAAYEAGRQLFDLEQASATIAGQIRQAHSDLDDIEHRIAHTEAQLVAPDTAITDRAHLLVDLKQLSEDKGKIKTALIALNRDQARADEELRQYKEYIAYNGPYGRPATEPTRVDY